MALSEVLCVIIAIGIIFIIGTTNTKDDWLVLDDYAKLKRDDESGDV